LGTTQRRAEFRTRCAIEACGNSPMLLQRRAIAWQGTVTLVYSARDTIHNDAAVLWDLLLGR